MLGRFGDINLHAGKREKATLAIQTECRLITMKGQKKSMSHQ